MEGAKGKKRRVNNREGIRKKNREQRGRTRCGGKEFPRPLIDSTDYFCFSRADLRTIVSSHPYNYTASLFARLRSALPAHLFLASLSPLRSLPSHDYTCSLHHKIRPLSAVFFQPSLSPPRLLRNCASFFSIFLAPLIYCG